MLRNQGMPQPVEQQTTIRRRLPAVEKTISDIKPEDVRVRLLGMIIGMTGSSLIFDDGSGKTEIVFDGPENLAGLNNGQMVRVVARVLPLIDGFECRGECVQSLEGFDIALYKRARELIAKGESVHGI